MARPRLTLPDLREYNEALPPSLTDLLVYTDFETVVVPTDSIIDMVCFFSSLPGTVANLCRCLAATAPVPENYSYHGQLRQCHVQSRTLLGPGLDRHGRASAQLRAIWLERVCLPCMSRPAVSVRCSIALAR